MTVLNAIMQTFLGWSWIWYPPASSLPNTGFIDMGHMPSKRFFGGVNSSRVCAPPVQPTSATRDERRGWALEFSALIPALLSDPPNDLVGHGGAHL